MSEWVAVCADENEEPVEIPTESDGKYFNIIFIKNLYISTFFIRILAINLCDSSVSRSHRVEVQKP